MPVKLKVAVVPHSWGFESWPSEVFPKTPQRARHVVRKHRDALMAHGALRKIGREWVIIGDAYCRWIEANARTAAPAESRREGVAA
jgi:hypothetical protein